MEKLAKSAVAAAKGHKEQAEAFDALGISVRDTAGNIKTVEQLALEIADKFSTMRDGAEKTALSIAIFGKAGANLIPVLNRGSEGIAELTKKAEEMGLKLSGEAAEGLAEIAEKTKLFKAAIEGAQTQIVVGLLPELHNLEAAFRGAGVAGENFRSIGEAIGIAVHALVLSLNDVNLAVYQVELAFIKFNLLDPFLSASLRAKLKEMEVFTTSMIDQAKRFEKEFNEHIAAATTPAARTGAPPSFGTGGKGASAAGGSADSFGGLGKELDDLVKSAQHVGGELVKAFKDPVEDAQRLIAQINLVQQALSERLGGAVVLIGNAQKTSLEQQISEYEKMQADLLKINDSMRQMKIAAEVLALPTHQVTLEINKWAEGAKKMGEEVGQSLTRILETGKGWHELLNVIIADFVKLIVQASGLADTLSGLGKKGGVGGFFGSLLGGLFGLGGFRAGGGDVMGGLPYVVGEQGPELFVPRSSGYIMPAGSWGGGGTQFTQINNVDARGAGLGAGPEIKRALQQTEDRAVARAVAAMQEVNRRR